MFGKSNARSQAVWDIVEERLASVCNKYLFVHCLLCAELHEEHLASACIKYLLCAQLTVCRIKSLLCTITVLSKGIPKRMGRAD